MREEVRDLGPAVTDLSENLARTLALGLSRLSGGEAPAVTFAAQGELSELDLLDAIAPLAANTLFGAGIRKLPFIASLEAASVFRLVDRAFGGRGDVPHPLPDAFPLSAELFATRLESVLAAAIGDALGPKNATTITAIERHGRIARLVPQIVGAKLTVLEFEVAEAGCAPWKVVLAIPEATLDALIAHDPAANPAKARKLAANPAEEPFGDVPLPVSAMLVEMQIAFSRLSALQPGDVLPVSVARNVPIRVGDKTIAYGTIGEVDDRVAVQLTRAF